MKRLNVLIAIFILLNIGGSRAEIRLEDNKYEGLVVAINPAVEEDLSLINKLQDLFTASSGALWEATGHRAYFGNIVIVVPDTWNDNRYEVARKQTYDKGNVVIAPENPVYGNMPYTEQIGQCGQPGKNIHLTPSYVMDPVFETTYGPKANTFVHEWAHLRWGIFDATSTSGYPRFYYDNDGVIQPTRSPSSIRGENLLIDFDTGETSTCQYVKENNWLPDSECVFVPFEEQKPGVHSSIMSYQYHEQLFTFDHDDTSDPKNLHNKDAPSEHNLLCDQRSEWDVIMSSTDFADGRNQPNNTVYDVTPTFSLVQQRAYKIVLALDVSGSMNDKQHFSYMKAAASAFINEFVPRGSKVGIVEFEAKSRTLSELSELTSMSDRRAMSRNLPTGTRSRTCIGCGLDQAVKVLESDTTKGPKEIIIFTDGDENTGPYVYEVDDEIYKNGIIVNTVFYGNTPNRYLEGLTELTQGSLHFVNASDLSSVMGAFSALAKTSNGDVFQKSHQILTDTYYVNYRSSLEGQAVMDSSIGNETTFSFTWSNYWLAPQISLIDPNGVLYTNDDAVVDVDLRTVAFRIPQTAAPGVWSFVISAGAHAQQVTAVVTSKAARFEVPPIDVESGFFVANETSEDPIVIYAKVSKGYQPLLGVEVIAKVRHPDGRITNLNLKDDGAVPDTRKSDGVYNRYFGDFSTSGKFSIQIEVIGHGELSEEIEVEKGRPGSSAAINYGYVKSDGTVVLNTNIPETSPPATAEEVGAFTRVASPGAFSHAGSKSSHSNDLIPPCRIIDLKAQQIDMLDVNQGLRLTFTAPGDDATIGKASLYELRYKYGTTSDLLDDFDNAYSITDPMVLQGDLHQPTNAYSKETVVVRLHDIPQQNDMVMVGFAIRAVDDFGNKGKVSNVAVLNAFLRPPAISCMDDAGYPESTKPFEKVGDCFRFYQCTNGELKTMPCAPGAVFDPSLSVCVHPSLVPKCNEEFDLIVSTTTSTRLPTTTEENTTNNVPTSTTTSTRLPTTTEENTTNNVPTSTTTASSTTTTAPGVPSCYDESGNPISSAPFQNKSNCQSYYQCNGGMLIEMNCPSGLVFNPSGSYCDWPQNVPGCS